jgi:hypothetical protein
MVTTGTKHALATENMTLAWREWKRWPIAKHTWPNWKTHWTAAFAEMRDINRMTAGESPFGANAAKEEVHACQIATSLDNLANASIQKNSAVNSLVASNAQLTQTLKNMQAAMACMYPPGQAQPYQGTAPAWWPNPPPTATPPAAPAPPATGVPPSQRPAHWGAVKLDWDKAGYCWSHGFKVKVGHTSATCMSRCTGHQPGATQANIMGGSWYNEGYPSLLHVPPPALPT